MGWPRVAVVGGGAVGGYFGGMLARAGAPVGLLGRPGPPGPHQRAIARDGLRIDGVSVQETVPLQILPRVEALAGAELVLFCVKTVDTETAAWQIAPYLAPRARVVSLQNGVDNVERMREATGIDAFPAVVFVAAAVETPGTVKHRGRGDLVIGHPTREAEAREIAGWFERAGVPCRVSERIEAELWLKLIINSMANAISALTGASYREIAEHEGAWRIALAIAREAVAVAAALGVPLELDRVVEQGREVIHSVGAATSSTEQDIARGRRTEIDSLNGYVARRGAELGIPTPTNDAMHALVRLREREALAREDGAARPG